MVQGMQTDHSEAARRRHGARGRGTVCSGAFGPSVPAPGPQPPPLRVAGPMDKAKGRDTGTKSSPPNLGANPTFISPGSCLARIFVLWALTRRRVHSEQQLLPCKWRGCRVRAGGQWARPRALTQGSPTALQDRPRSPGKGCTASFPQAKGDGADDAAGLPLPNPKHWRLHGGRPAPALTR